MQRDDDTEETVRSRLKVYHEQTAPLITYYSDWAANGENNAPSYTRIDGVGSMEDIRDQIFSALGD